MISPQSRASVQLYMGHTHTYDCFNQSERSLATRVRLRHPALSVLKLSTYGMDWNWNVYALIRGQYGKERGGSEDDSLSLCYPIRCVMHVMYVSPLHTLRFTADVIIREIITGY